MKFKVAFIKTLNGETKDSESDSFEDLDTKPCQPLSNPSISYLIPLLSRLICLVAPGCVSVLMSARSLLDVQLVPFGTHSALLSS